jgi:hypothetical protein
VLALPALELAPPLLAPPLPPELPSAFNTTSAQLK